MRNIFLSILAVAMCFIVACDSDDALPPYTVSPIFNASSSMTHVRDTIWSGKDTLKFKVSGYIADTSRKYAISATIKATDTTTALNLISGNYIKTVAVKFDTVGYANTKMFRWQNADTNSLYLTIPAIAAKTKLRTTILFSYGLNLSSQTGNTTSTGSKFAYAK
jgi:hypothetical protein